MRSQVGPDFGKVGIDQRHGERLADRVAITARGDKADLVAGRPDRLVAAGIGTVRHHLEGDEAMRRAIAVTLGKRCLTADKASLFQSIQRSMPVMPGV